jgi:hypothetical protein
VLPPCAAAGLFIVGGGGSRRLSVPILRFEAAWAIQFAKLQLVHVRCLLLLLLLFVLLNMKSSKVKCET